ncbi:hypothetical protein GLYMA_02G125300v4 [Glycine max]|uniref:Uncharacterized protein n=1 Tax=Glycine max TaxID=3847 RepID=K7K7Y4_SOYBN|nr:hypothetical protein JHK85_004101 [Glycine max]KAH1060018.1 hypothetical protein GYH30_003820 [Glycine max]KRH71035.1 hypothetical protein GLYMA_02G125300v4 [Glycine max]
MGGIYYAEINVVCIIDCFHGLLFSSFFEQSFLASFSLSFSLGGAFMIFGTSKFSVGFGNGSWKLV